jgi:anthranilate/para-aminobenzoate synthase component I
MQIIDELEVAARGPYTGSIGYISDCGRACFNIAIRTAVLRGAARDDARGPLDAVESGTWSYSVGAGIVADSDPIAEWDETLAKAEPIFGLCREHLEQTCPPHPLHPTPAIA